MDRQELIDICTAGVVPVGSWHDRDSPDAQRKLGTARALLLAGCEYQMSADPKTDGKTIWIEIQYPGFSAFEYGRDDRENWESELFYLPTRARLEQVDGGDWY